MNSTSNTDINIGTRVLFVPELPDRQQSHRLDGVSDRLRPAANSDYPSPAEIERMTREVVDEILRGWSDSDLNGHGRRC